MWLVNRARAGQFVSDRGLLSNEPMAVLFSEEKAGRFTLGFLTLDSPRSLNALDLAMLRAIGENLFDLHLLGRQPLLVRIFDKEFEHRPVGFETVREGVVAENVPGHGQILQAEEERRRDTLNQFLLRQRLGLDEGGVQVKGDPGILPMNVAADDVGVVWREEAIFLEESYSFGDAVGKQGLDLAPVSAAPGNAARAIDDVRHSRPRAPDGRSIQLVIDQHRRQALVGRDSGEGNPRGRLEAGRSAMAQLLAPLHVPVNLILRHTKVVLQDSAHPQRSRLLIFRDANALPIEITRFLHARVKV